MRRCCRPFSATYFASFLWGLYSLVSGPFAALPLGPGDVLYGLVLGWAFILGLTCLGANCGLSPFRRTAIRRTIRRPEPFIAVVLLLGLFEYVFALNANMDYVQRFIESGGNLTLALDTETERVIVLARYLPLLAAGLVPFIAFRLFNRGAVDLATSAPGRPEPVAAAETVDGGRFFRLWGLPITVGSATLHALSFPSFLSLDGFGWLAWVALAPLFLVFRHNGYGRGVFLSAVFGSFTMILSNYWLGTFSLVSLQLTIVFFLLFYLLFGAVVLFPLRRMRRGGFFYLAIAWIGFEYLRSIGFLGYPWVLVGHSQYASVRIIQAASVAGVWGVSALVLLVNAGIATAYTLARRPSNRIGLGRFVPSFASVLFVVAVSAAGGLTLGDVSAAEEESETARIALIQQNSDPRKHDYERTFDSLRRLTDASLAQEPDLVAWSETAFVPNIRRWSQEDPRRYRLARLVLGFAAYQESLGTWLVTGNDDYRQVLDEEGEEIDRLNFNAAVLFSPAGDRVDTYHKVKLVPFTEYFPYRNQLPWVYDLLQEFDVHFWEPGSERLVFHHPEFRFATPICFEDLFPNHIRLFIRQGVDVILAITNDYWSLSPVQAKQHFAAGLFRTVENRRPMVRATASGLTGHIDAYGRIHSALPYYEEAFTVAEVSTGHDETTLYGRFGDWFPILCLVIAVAWSLAALTRNDNE